MPSVPSQKKRPVILARSVAALLSLGFLLGVQKAAADEYWDGTSTGSGQSTGQGGSGQWDTTTNNWVDITGNNPAPYDPNQTAIFAGNSGGTVTLGSDLTFSALRFDISGYDIASGSGPFKLTPTGSGTITTSSGITVTIDAQLTGSNQVDFEGTGTITLTNGANDYSGGTIIGSSGSGPIVVISSDGNLGNPSSPVTMDGGNLQTTSTISTSRSFVLNAGGGAFLPDAGTVLTLNGPVSGSGPLSINGSGAVVLGDSLNSYSGGTNLINGTLVISADGDLGNTSGGINFNGGTLETTATFTTARAVVINASSGPIFADSGTVLTLNGMVSGNGAFSATGQGTIVLGNASNSYLGGTNIVSGTVAISTDGNLGNTGGAINFSGGTLETTADVQTSRTINLTSSGSLSPDAGTTLTVLGQITGSGSFNVTGAGTVLLDGTANNYTGPTSISNGTLQAGAPNVVSSTSAITVNSSGTFDLNGFDQTIPELAGAGKITLGSGTATLTVGDSNSTTFSGSITGTGNITKVGSGSLTLSGTSSYTGATLISTGTLGAGASNALSSNSAVTISSGATLALNGFSQTIGSLAGVGTVTLGNGTLTVGADNTSTSFSGLIQGTGGLGKTGTGTFTLTGSVTNPYTGATIVNRGTLVIAPTTTNPLLSSSSRLILGGATADGGTFQLNGLAGSVTTQVMNGLTVNSSQNEVLVNNLGTSTTLDLRGTSGTAGITHNGGSVDFAATTGNLSNTTTTGASVLTAQANDSTGILGGWATVNHGADLATKDANGFIVAFTGYHDIAARGDVVPNQPTWNVRIETPGTTGNDTLAAKTTNINTLTQNAGTDSTIDTAGGTLRLGKNGGILISSAGANLTIGTTADPGVLTAGGSAANTAGTLNLNNSSSTSLLEINSAITNNGTGVVSVVVGGTGTTGFAGTNTYTGTTTVSGGTLRVDANNSTSANSDLFINSGATFNVNDHSTVVGAINNGAAGGGTIALGAVAGTTLTVGGNNANGAFSGTISGAGQIIKNGTGTQTISGTGNTYSGGTTLNSGRLNVNGSSTDGSGTMLGSGTLTINGGTLGTTIEPTSGSSGTTISNPVSLKGDFSIATNVDSASPGAQNITLSGLVNLNGTTRTITGIVNGGQIHFGAGGIGTAAETAGVNFNTTFTKDGDYAEFIFDAANTNKYTGLTTVNNGAFLALNGSTADGAIQGNLDIEGNGTVAYLNGSSSVGQIANTAAVTVNSKGNTIGSNGHVDGLEFAGASETIGFINGSGTVGLGGGTLTVGGGGFNGVIEDGAFGTGGSLTKVSGNTLILGGKNTYTGATTISAGTVQLGVTDAIPLTSVVTVASGGNLDLHGFDQHLASVTGSGNIQLGSGTLTVGSNNTNAAFNGNITGTGGLTKVGTGTLTLGGASTYSGNTTITQGILIAAPTGTTPVLGSSSSLVLGGAAANNNSTFQLNGIAGTPTTQVLNGLTIGAGNNSVIVNTPVGTTTTLDLRGTSGTAGITRNAGFVDFSASGGGVLGTDAIIRTAQANDAGGIIGAWATVNNGSDFATNQGGIIVGLNSVGGYTDIGATFDIVPNGSNLNVRINKPAGTTSTSNDVIATQPVTSINTLTQNTGTASTVDLQGGTLQLGSAGGILITPSGSSLTIGATANNGVLTAAPGGTSPSSITLANNNTASTLTINSVIEDNGTTPVSVRLTGTGTTVFAGTNIYSGTTSILSGTLQTNTDHALGNNSAVTINTNAILNLNGHAQVVGSIADGPSGSGSITFGSGGALTTGGDNTSTTFSGAISGTGNLTKVGTGTLTLSGNSSYVGNTTLANGGLILNSNSALGSSSGTLFIAPTGTNTVSIGSTVADTTISNAVSVKGDFSISTAGFGKNFSLSGPIDLNGATRTITGTTNGGQANFGNISNGGVTLDTVFTKTGDYVAFIYNGANTYTGKTTVNNGAILVFQGTTANGGAKGDVDIEGNGVVDYIAGSSSVAQLTNTATVTVNSSGNTLGGSHFDGFELRDASDTINILNGKGSVGLGSGTLTLNSGDFSGVIEDGAFGTKGNLTKNSTGTLFLSGTGAYTGATTINAGTIQANAAFALAPDSAFTISAGATLDINKYTEQVGSITGGGTIKLGSGTLVTGFDGTNTTFSGVLQDGGISNGKGGGIIKVDGQTSSGQDIPDTLTLTGANTYTGQTWVFAGTLQAGAANTVPLKSQVLLNSGATFDLNDFSQSVGSLSNGTVFGGIIDLGTATLTIGNDNRGAFFLGTIQGTGGLIKVGSGIQFLDGINTYTGPTTVSKGTLGLTSASSLASVVTVNNVATFDNSGSVSLGSTTQAVNITAAEGRVVNELGGLLSANTGVTVNNATGISYVINFGTITGTAAATPVAVNALNSAGVVIGDFGKFNGSVLLNSHGVNTVILATKFAPDQVHNPLAGSAGPNDTLELAGSSVDTLDIARAHGYEFLHKVGGGMWTLNGTNSFVGGTRISGGTINLQGNLISDVRVDSAASLAGTGSVLGNVMNLGLVLPGLPSDAFSSTIKPGMLSVRNNYTQGPDGALVIQVNGKGAGQYSQLSIGGHAQLGGSLFVQEGGTVDLKLGEKLTFLTANGGVSGRFSTVSDPFATGTVVGATVVYGPNSVSLQGSQGSFAAVGDVVQLTHNQQAVANALDSGLANKGNQKLISYLDTRKLADLPANFDQIAPEAVASVYRIGVSLADVQAHNIQRRTADLRAGASGFDASEFQTTGGANYTGGLAGANGPSGAEGKNVNPQAPDRRWGAFIKGVGDFAHVGDTGNARGYDMNTGGVTVGADYRLSNRLAVGVTAGYTGTDAQLNNNGHVIVNGGKAGVYGTYFDKGFYADAAVTGGVNNYTTRRASVQGDAYGHTQGGEVDMMVDTGYDWRVEGLTIGPTASFQYTYLGIDGFTEHGSLAPLRYLSQHQDSIRTTLGMHVSYDWKIGKVIVRPEGMLEWQHEYGDRSYSIDSALAGGSSVFSVSDPQLGRDSFLLSAGVSVLWNPRTSTFLYYDADVLKKEYDSQSVTGGLRMNF